MMWPRSLRCCGRIRRHATDKTRTNVRTSLGGVEANLGYPVDPIPQRDIGSLTRPATAAAGLTWEATSEHRRTVYVLVATSPTLGEGPPGRKPGFAVTRSQGQTRMVAPFVQREVAKRALLEHA